MPDANRLLRLQNKYQKILLNDGGLRTLCDVLTEEIGNPIFILDKYQENLLYIDCKLRRESDFYSYLDKKKIIKQEIVFAEYNNRLERVVYSWRNQEVKELQIKLGSGNEVLGILSILERTGLEKGDYLAIIQGVHALSLKLHQNHLVQNLARKCSNELIEDLLKGRLKDKGELIKRGELAGWDLTVSYQLFIFRTEFSKKVNDNCNGERSLYKYEMEEKIIHSLHRIIRTNLSRKYIIFSYDDDILLLIHYSTRGEEIKKEIKDIYRQLKKKFIDIDILAGAGGFIEDCSSIAESYQQGLYTLNFLATTNQKKRLFFYEDLGVLRLLWQIDSPQLMEFTREFLSKLIDYDQQTGTDWIETLGFFLQEGGSIQQAADRLHIHPNTMRYRVKRIQEILGFDLHNFETQLNLATAYKIYKFIICNQEEGGG